MRSGLALLAVLLAIAPASAQVVQSKCAAAKKACITKKVKALLACHAAADKKGGAVDPTCLAKAHAKFDGGATPAKGCFAKLEAKQNPAKPATLCPSAGDTALIENQVDAFVDAMVCQLAGGCNAGERCDDPILINPGSFAEHSTVGFDFDYDACGLPGAFDGPDRVYRIVVPNGKVLTVTVTPVSGSNGANIALFAGSANCGSSDAGLCADVDTASQSEQVQVSAENSSGASRDYFLLVGTGGLDPVEYDMLVAIGD